VIIVTSRDILIVAAHESEAIAMDEALNKDEDLFEILVTGVGGMCMSWELQKRLLTGTVPSIIINAGIAGTFNTAIKTGDVVMAESDCFADLGIDDNGRFIPLYLTDIDKKNSFPFSDGRIVCDNNWAKTIGCYIPSVKAATVNMVSGSDESIARIVSAWNPDIETMEGAWLAYICRMSSIPWLNIRSVSNVVEPRNVSSWDIKTALLSLRKSMPDIIKTIIDL